MNKNKNLDGEELEMGFWRQVFNGVFIARLLVGAVLGAVPASAIAFGVSDWVADRSNERMNTIDSNITDLSHAITNLNSSVINLNGDMAGEIRDGLKPTIEAINRRMDHQTSLIVRAQKDIEDNTEQLNENVKMFTNSIGDLKLQISGLAGSIKSARNEFETVADMSKNMEVWRAKDEGTDKKLNLILDALKVPNEKR